VYFLRASINADVLGAVLAPRRPRARTEHQSGAGTGTEGSGDCGDYARASPPSPRHIILSALTLLATLFWCFVVWCGLLGGSVEGAVFAFYGVLPLALLVLPAGGCYSSGVPGRACSPSPHNHSKGCFLCSSTIFRVMWPTSYEREGAPPFVEVFVADALTSLSKAISDCGLVASVVIARSVLPLLRLRAASDNGVGPEIMLSLVLPPLLGSLPYLLRIAQVLLALRATTSAAERRNHFLNLAKYMANFPGIWLQAVLSSLPPAASHGAFGVIGMQIQSQHLLGESEQASFSPPPSMGFLGSLVWAFGFYHPHGSPSALLADVPVDRRALKRAVLVLGFASGLFSFLWDVQVDWGLSTAGTEIFATPRHRLAALAEPPGDMRAASLPKVSSSSSVLSSPSSQIPSKPKSALDSETLLPSIGSLLETREAYVSDTRQTCGLRRQLLLGGLSSLDAKANSTSHWIYHGAVAFNLVARLASALLNLTDIPSIAKLRGIDLNLLLQVLEVLRRSVWSVFRIEFECIKKALEEGGSAWHGRHM
jgi:hypothetical protein